MADRADGNAAISTSILALSATGLRTAVHVLSTGHLEQDGTRREARDAHTSFVLHVDVGFRIGAVAPISDYLNQTSAAWMANRGDSDDAIST